MYKILSINPGSTSTKISLYEDEKEILTETLRHKDEDLAEFDKVQDQFEFREKIVLDFLKRNNYDINKLDAVVGRGGILPPVEAGAYIVNDIMVDYLKNRPRVEHASNLAALIAYEISKLVDIPAYIYDSIAVYELDPVAKITGIPEIERDGLVHTLNMRASAIEAAKSLGKEYKNCRLIVAHLGGGVTLSSHRDGKMIDVLSDDEGPFSPERSGGLPGRGLVKMCFSHNYTAKDVTRKMRGNSGLKAHLGTSDLREVEKMIEEGNSRAELVYEAMAYQIAKGVGQLSTVLKGKMDAIVITGGMAYSEKLIKLIKERIDFLGNIIVMPGENEMKSLTLGTLRVLKGEEKAKEFLL
ncbi:MAG: butyrate kinase [Bacillota bacterium]|nr:butyrate kinase [Bacillota bacterium]